MPKIILDSRYTMTSYVHNVPKQPFQTVTVMQCLDTKASQNPDQEVCIFYDDHDHRSALTFAQFHDQSYQFAAALLQIGFKPGSRVAIMAPNCPEFVVGQMALSRLGIVVVLLGMGKPTEALKDTLNKHSCCGLLCHLSQDSKNQEETIETLAASRSSDTSDDSCIFTGLIVIGGVPDNAPANVYTYDKLLEMGETLDVSSVKVIQDTIQFDDPFITLSTSGSTGEPKLSLFSHHQMVNRTLILSGVIGINDSSSVQFNDRPFTWIGGFMGLVTVPLRGAKVVSIINTSLTVQNAESSRALGIIQNERCTIAAILPYLMYDIGSRQGAYDLSCLKVAGTGGQPIPQTLASAFLKMYPSVKIVGIYGCTEATLAAFVSWDAQRVNSDAYITEMGSYEIADAVEIKLTDDEGRVVKRDERGEINIRGVVVMTEYLDNEEATQKSLDKFGWFHTGDIGVMNKEGHLKIVGRKSDMIKRATRTIFPAEVESVLSKYPSIGQVTVVGVPDARLYEDLCACVISNETTTFEPNEAFDFWCRDRFPPDLDGFI